MAQEYDQEFLTKFRNLPQEIQQYLTGEKLIGIEDSLKTKLQLTEEKMRLIHILIIKIFMGQAPLKALLPLLKLFSGLDEKSAFTTAQILREKVFAKYQDFINQSWTHHSLKKQEAKPGQVKPFLEGNIVDLRNK